MKIICTRWVVLVGVAVLSCVAAHAQNDLDEKIDRNTADWGATYKHIHEYPELSTQEKETAALVAGTLQKLGYDVTDHFGKYEEPDLISYGVVAVKEERAGSDGVCTHGAGRASGEREHRAFASLRMTNRI